MYKPVEGGIESQEYVLDVRHLWRVLMRQKFNIAALSLVVSVLAAIVISSWTPIYRASATLLIESESAKVLSIEDVYDVRTDNREYFSTQFEILKSRELAARVVRRLKLDGHPLFDPRQQKKSTDWASYLPEWLSFAPVDEGVVVVSEEDAFDSVVAAVSGGLIISPVGITQLVKINYESSDPKLAAQIANTLAEVYIESHLEAKLSVTRKATDWLGERIGDLRNNLKASEDKLQEYKEREQLVDIDGVRTLDAKELSELTQNLVESRNLRVQLDAVAQQVSRLGKRPKVEELLALSSILEHPLVQTLKQEQGKKELKVAELSKRYGPGHPKMISALSEASSAKSELRNQVTRVASGIQSDYRRALSAERNLQGQVGSIKKRLQSVNRKEVRLRELEREVETNRHLYELFLTRSKETGETIGLQAAHARVVDKAIVPKSPVKPRKKVLISIVALLSVMVGVALALLQDVLNNSVRTPDDVEERLSSEMLGFLPLVRSNKSKNVFEGLVSDASGNFAEAIRTIRTSVLLSSIDEPYKVTVVTSSVPNEGKSTVSLNLAEAMGEMERVLLVDADMRRPSLAKAVKLSRSSVGLSNFIDGSATLKECVHRIDGFNVDVITSGVVPSNPLELLSSSRFGEALQKLSKFYDRIVIDSAPVHAVSDSLVLSGFADAVIYVVKADDTPAPLAAKGIQRLRGVGAPVIGVVLNKVDMNKSKGYSSYYGYYSSYGYTADELKG